MSSSKGSSSSHLDEQSDDDEDSEEETTETSSEETEDEHQGRRRKKTGNTESNTWPRFSDLGTPPLTPDYNMQTARVRGENRVLFHEEVTPTSCEQSDGVFNPEKRTVKKYKNFSYRAPEESSSYGSLTKPFKQKPVVPGLAKALKKRGKKSKPPEIESLNFKLPHNIHFKDFATKPAEFSPIRRRRYHQSDAGLHYTLGHVYAVSEARKLSFLGSPVPSPSDGLPLYVDTTPDPRFDIGEMGRLEQKITLPGSPALARKAYDDTDESRTGTDESRTGTDETSSSTNRSSAHRPSGHALSGHHSDHVKHHAERQKERHVASEVVDEESISTEIDVGITGARFFQKDEVELVPSPEARKNPVPKSRRKSNYSEHLRECEKKIKDTLTISDPENQRRHSNRKHSQEYQRRHSNRKHSDTRRRSHRRQTIASSNEKDGRGPRNHQHRRKSTDCKSPRRSSILDEPMVTLIRQADRRNSHRAKRLMSLF